MSSSVQETIEMKKYSIIEAEFEKTDNIVCMIRAMLSLERLWTPFLYATQGKNDIQEKIRIYMDGIWERIFLDKIDYSKRGYYEQILDEVDEEYCSNEYNMTQKFYYDRYLVNALASGFGWFFGRNSKKRPDIVLSAADLIHDKIVDDNDFIDEQEKIIYFSTNKYMLEELRRIDEDCAASIVYARNKDEILQLREKYQNMWIIPIEEKI